MDTLLFDCIELIVGLVLTFASAPLMYRAVKRGWQTHQTGDSFTCAAVLCLLFGLAGTVGSIANWADFTGRPDWYCLIAFVLWLGVVATTWAAAIRKALRPATARL